jgi:HEAT repeat protein
VRGAALAVLDGIEDRRALDAAVAALEADAPDVAIAAARVLRGWVTHEQGTRVFDALATAALDPSRHAGVREAAIEALSDLPPDLVRPILERAPQPPPAVVDDPDAVRDWLLESGKDAPLSALHDTIVRAREREQGETSATRRQEWQALRGAAHAALARRESRVALYDLREAFDTAAASLPLDYLSAITAIGDASCLEPMARAWAAAPAETWWRERLSAAAEAIVHRTRLSGRSPVLKRVRAKWTGFV